MAVILSHSLLVVFLLSLVYSKDCPTGCTCNRDVGNYTCTVNNQTVDLELDLSVGSYYSTLIIKCQNQDLVSCSSFPRLGVVARRVEAYSCSPSILRCVHVVLDEPVVQELELYHVDGTLTVEDVADLKYVKKLHLELTGDIPIPIEALNSWTSLKDIFIREGTLQLINSFNHTSLTSLAFLNTKMRAVPDGDFQGLSNLEVLAINNSTIEEIRVGALRGLGNLKELRIGRCPLKSVDADAFTDVPRLEQLGLGGILLNSFPEGLIDRLKSLIFVGFSCSRKMSEEEFKLGPHAFSQHPTLISVRIETCRINTLTENLFNNSSHVVLVNMVDNIINHMEPKIFSNLTGMITLDLHNNSLHEIPEGIFDRLSALQTLNLANNGLKTLHDSIFKDLTSLNTLNMYENQLQELPDGIFSALKSLKTLNLADNELSVLEIGILSNMAKLRSINLSKNKLQELPALSHLKMLNTLDLSDNKIVELDEVMFIGLRQLTELNLRNNKIIAIDAGVSRSTFFSPFQSLRNLTKLDLSGNKIRGFFHGWQSHLQSVRQLNLSSNRFADIEVFQVNYTSLDMTVDLRYNSISKVVLDPRTANSNSSKNPSKLLLDYNPIICDCNAFGLYRRLKGARLEDEPQYVLNSYKCISPASVEGTLLEEVSPKDLICDLSKHRPENCSSFIARADINEVTVTCSHIPSLTDVNADDFQYTFYEPPNIALNLDEQPTGYMLDIYKLNVSHTNMKQIDFKPTAALRVLDLSKNNLEKIPDYFFNPNISLYLADNPLVCDCALAKKLKKFNDSVVDFNDVFCANEDKNLTDIDENEICNRTTALTALIGTTAVCGLFLTMIAVALCKYIIRNWTDIVSNLRWREAEIVPLEKVDIAKKFDVFVSFAHQDEEFVREDLIPKLEYEMKQRVCVHYRDWSSGDTVPDQIIRSVDNSEKTIIVLTEDFVTSENLLISFKRANYLSEQEGRAKIILVIFDNDITKDEKLSDDLKSYITINSCLVWGHDNFWEDMKINLS